MQQTYASIKLFLVLYTFYNDIIKKQTTCPVMISNYTFTQRWDLYKFKIERKHNLRVKIKCCKRKMSLYTMRWMIARWKENHLQTLIWISKHHLLMGCFEWWKVAHFNLLLNLGSSLRVKLLEIVKYSVSPTK